MRKNADYYNKQGLRIVHSGRLGEAIDFFTKAIEIDPALASAYQNRGETYLLLNRIVEANTDIKKSKDLRAGKLSPLENETPTAKIPISDIDSIYDTVFPGSVGRGGNDPLEFDSSFYDYVFSDDAIESDEAWSGIIQGSPEQGSLPAIIEFLGGERLEATGVIPFKPTQDDISLILPDGHVERVIPLEQLACFRMTGIPVRSKINIHHQRWRY